jgi:hypothetical protein
VLFAALCYLLAFAEHGHQIACSGTVALRRGLGIAHGDTPEAYPRNYCDGVNRDPDDKKEPWPVRGVQASGLC